VRRPRPGAALAVALGLLASSCGGGGGGGGAATPAGEPAATSTPYAHSVALGSWSPQSIAYAAGSGTTADMVTSAAASPLLPQGAAPLLARHGEASLPGALEVCVSGTGDSTNVVAPINIGVVAQSAAVLLDASWSPVPDAAAAWAELARRKAVLTGWENCGVKPEGAPSPSSRLTVQADGSYAEDVYDGNPGTTYNVVSQVFSAAQVTAMLGPQGWSTVADPARPMQLFWRIYANGQGQQLLIEMGVPRPTAPASLKGFIALYVPAS
jgi:hypothetical protein